MINLNELAEKAEKATQGEWFAVKTDRETWVTDKWKSEGWTVSPEQNYLGWETDSGISGYSLSKDNAEFMASMNPQTALALIRAVRASQDVFWKYQDDYPRDNVRWALLANALKEFES